MDRRLVALLMASLTVTACAYSNAREGAAMSNDAPPPVALNLSGQCDSVSGWYANAGIALRAQNVVKHPRLAHSLFRLALPSKDGYPRLPNRVRLAAEPANMTLQVTLVGDDVTREWSTGFECEDGWMRIRDYQGKQYLGDGVTQKWAKKVVWLAVDVNGNLVAHVIGDAEDKTFLGGRHRSGGEDWYMFQMIKGVGSKGSESLDQRGQSHWIKGVRVDRGQIKGVRSKRSKRSKGSDQRSQSH